MPSRGMRTWGVPRALIALAVAVLVTATAVRIFIAKSPAPQASAQLVYAGSQVDDSYGEVPETTQPASPSILIETDLDRTASIASYLMQAGGLNQAQAVAWAS